MNVSAKKPNVSDSRPLEMELEGKSKVDRLLVFNFESFRTTTVICILIVINETNGFYW